MTAGDHGGGDAEFRPFVASTAHHGIIEGEAAPLVPAFPTSPSDARSLATSESGTLKVTPAAVLHLLALLVDRQTCTARSSGLGKDLLPITVCFAIMLSFVGQMMLSLWLLLKQSCMHWCVLADMHKSC